MHVKVIRLQNILGKVSQAFLRELRRCLHSRPVETGASSSVGENGPIMPLNHLIAV